MNAMNKISVAFALFLIGLALPCPVEAADCSARGGGIFDAKVSLENEERLLILIPELSGEAHFAGSLKLRDCEPDLGMEGNFFVRTPLGSRIELESVDWEIDVGPDWLYFGGGASFEGESVQFTGLLEENYWPEPNSQITLQLFKLVEVSGITVSEVVIDIRGPVILGSLAVKR